MCLSTDADENTLLMTLLEQSIQQSTAHFNSEIILSLWCVSWCKSRLTPDILDNIKVDLLTTLDWLVKMAYWSSYDTTENSSSDVQWTVIVSYEAVHNSSRIVGGFGAAKSQKKRQMYLWESWMDSILYTTWKNSRFDEPIHSYCVILTSVIKLAYSSPSYDS